MNEISEKDTDIIKVLGATGTHKMLVGTILRSCLALSFKAYTPLPYDLAVPFKSIHTTKNVDKDHQNNTPENL